MIIDESGVPKSGLGLADLAQTKYGEVAATAS